MNRRTALKQIVGTTTLGLAATRLGATARAQGIARPRFIFIYTPSGREPSWRTGTAGPDFKLSDGMNVFAPYRKKMCLFEGFTVPNFGYHLNAHWASLHCLLGGKAPLQRSGNSGGGLSEGSQRTFDHLIADRIGKNDPVKNIVVGGLDRDNDNGSLLASWSGPKQPQHPNHDPAQVFKTLFSGASNAPLPNDTAAIEARKRARAWERDVLGLSREQTSVFRAKLGHAEKIQLEAYESHLEGTFKQVQGDGPEISNIVAQCPVTTYEALSANIPSTQNFARQHDLQSRVLAAALACGRTSVGTFVMAGIRSGMTVPGGAGGHHHHDDGAINHYKAFDAYYNARVKFLLDELSKYPEGDGTVLDNTVIVWTSDIAWTPVEHDHDNMPITMFGGVPGGKLKMGQYIKAPYNSFGNNRIAALASPTNRRLHEIYLTVASAMGITDLDGFADPKFVQGPVKELLP